MSKFYSQYLVNHLLEGAKSELKSNSVFIGLNQEQECIINFDNQGIDIEEIETVVQIGGYDKVQSLMESKDMNYIIPSKIFADSVICGLYMLILAKWRDPGQDDLITKDDKTIDAAYMDCAHVQQDNNGNIFASLYCDNYDPTYNGDLVIFEVLSNDDTSEQDLAKNGNHFLDSIKTNKARYAAFDGMIFPQAELDISRKVEELIGISVEDTNYVFNEAMLQCKLKINHLGAKLEVAMYGGMMAESIPNPTWVINGTYAVHFTRKNVLYASVLITPNDFKKVEIDFG
jgi:hypothetical protein